MDGMGMGMGMDMSGSGMFKGTNMLIARAIWYLVATVVALLAVRRVIEKARSYISLAKVQRQSSTTPSRPENILSQTYDTTIALCRELAYPQIYWFSGHFTKYFNPPALGRILFLLGYWIVILTSLWSNTILTPSSPNYAYKWEIVGFRAAWVSVTQLPLIYLLGSKVNLVSLVTGISYERLNWLHRWIGRTLFLTVIVHWSFFFREWWLADFVDLELGMMPMVKYGFGAWGVLGWMVLTGFGFFRHLAYEFFVLQHIASFTVLLWLVYIHVPAYAQYNVWMAVSFVALDHIWRYIAIVVQNIHLGFTSNARRQKYALGFSAQAQALPDDYVIMTIDNLTVSVGVGQHVYVSLPRCGFLQWHPFTIVKALGSTSGRIVLKAHSGFTRKLLESAKQQPQRDFRIIVSSPFGSPPLDIIERCDSLILWATSTGATFTVSILQHVANKRLGIRRICFYWVVRDISHLDWFSSDIVSALDKLRSSGIKVCVQIYVTRQWNTHRTLPFTLQSPSLSSQSDKTDSERRGLSEDVALLSTEKIREASRISSDTKATEIRNTSVRSSSSSTDLSASSSFPVTHGRPVSLDPLIRPTVEESDGETAIIACGNPTFMAEIRNYAAALSDERAVHKGTGAQGIFLFTETYGW